LSCTAIFSGLRLRLPQVPPSRAPLGFTFPCLGASLDVASYRFVQSRNLDLFDLQFQPSQGGEIYAVHGRGSPFYFPRWFVCRGPCLQPPSSFFSARPSFSYPLTLPSGSVPAPPQQPFDCTRFGVEPTQVFSLPIFRPPSHIERPFLWTPFFFFCLPNLSLTSPSAPPLSTG